MKDEQSRTKQLEVTLLQNRYELNQILEEIRELKEQSRKNLEDTNLLEQENDRLKKHSGHLEELLNHKGTFVISILDEPNHDLPPEGSMVLVERNACLTSFAEQAT